MNKPTLHVRAGITPLLVASTLVGWGAAAAPAADADWKAGLATVKITPTQPVLLAGYAGRNKPFDSVADDLFAKALALEDGRGHRAVLVTTDLIGLRASYAETVCERIGQKTGVKRSQILLNSSHTHAGPTLGLERARLGDLPAADAERTVAYSRQLQDQLVQLAVDALARLEPARLSWGTGVATFVMNRREFTPAGVILGANPRGLADRSVPVLRVDGPDGKLRAVLFGCACHNTTLTAGNYAVSGDYAGYAQSHIEKRHPGATALFMIGCGGDANPYPRGTLDLAKLHGTSLGQEVYRVLDTKLQPVRGPLRTEFGHADLPLQAVPSREELQKLALGRQSWQPSVARRMLAALERGDPLPRHYTCPLAVWQFGEDLTLVGLAGEVVVDYVASLEKALGPQRLWVAAYCNDVFGYLPSARVLQEGGYETRGLTSGGLGFFAPEAQDVVVDKVRNLARQAGRPNLPVR
jgi:hypothetical protein